MRLLQTFVGGNDDGTDHHPLHSRYQEDKGDGREQEQD
jgi:hypothetical protein